MLGSSGIIDQKWGFWVNDSTQTMGLKWGFGDGVKIGQLEMSVVSREPIMHSGFFRLKHTFIIGKQKKLYIKGFLWQLSSQKIPK